MNVVSVIVPGLLMGGGVPPTPVIPGPVCAAAGSEYSPGSFAGGAYTAGPFAGGEYSPGSFAGKGGC